jgi:hypothetical protein
MWGSLCWELATAPRWEPARAPRSAPVTAPLGACDGATLGAADGADASAPPQGADAGDPPDREHLFVLWGATLGTVADLLAAAKLPACRNAGGMQRKERFDAVTRRMHLTIGFATLPAPRAVNVRLPPSPSLCGGTGTERFTRLPSLPPSLCGGTGTERVTRLPSLPPPSVAVQGLRESRDSPPSLPPSLPLWRYSQ